MLTVEVANLSAFVRAVSTFAEEIQRGAVGVVQGACLDGAEHARAVGSFQDHSGSNGLRASIKAFPTTRTGQGAEGSFGTVKSYAAIVEGGSRPHEIRPRRAAALRWVDNGEPRFARVVRHPGTAPRPFMGPAAIKAQAALYARAEILTAAAIARFERA